MPPSPPPRQAGPPCRVAIAATMGWRRRCKLASRLPAREAGADPRRSPSEARSAREGRVAARVQSGLDPVGPVAVAFAASGRAGRPLAAAAVPARQRSRADRLSSRRAGRGGDRRECRPDAPSFGHSDRIHPVRTDADRRRAVSPPHARRRPVRARDDHDLQARLHGLQIRPRPRRPRPPSRARVGDPCEPVPAPDGLCAAVAAFREQPDSGRDAGVLARRLERGPRPFDHRRRGLQLPRQYRGGADRRHDGAPRLPRQGSHRLSRRDRRRLQRGRRRQRGRRYHDDHDVDRRREPAQRDRGVRRGRGRALDLRHPGGDPAASVLADRQRRPAGPAASTGCGR